MVLDRKNWNFVNERLFLLGIEGEPSQKVNRVSEEKAKPQSKTLSVGIWLSLKVDWKSLTTLGMGHSPWYLHNLNRMRKGAAILSLRKEIVELDGMIKRWKFPIWQKKRRKRCTQLRIYSWLESRSAQCACSFLAGLRTFPALAVT